MTVSQYASLKMEAVLDLIYRLKDTDFPYSHSKDALYKVESVFKELQQNLGKAEARGDNLLIRTICTRILEQIFRFLPVIGFILRSTNVRNAFEVHGPLLRMSKKLLGPETKLLVSSEWDYSPYLSSDPVLRTFCVYRPTIYRILKPTGHPFGGARTRALHLAAIHA